MRRVGLKYKKFKKEIPLYNNIYNKIILCKLIILKSMYGVMKFNIGVLLYVKGSL